MSHIPVSVPRTTPPPPQKKNSHLPHALRHKVSLRLAVAQPLKANQNLLFSYLNPDSSPAYTRGGGQSYTWLKLWKRLTIGSVPCIKHCISNRDDKPSRWRTSTHQGDYGVNTYQYAMDVISGDVRGRRLQKPPLPSFVVGDVGPHLAVVPPVRDQHAGHTSHLAHRQSDDRLHIGGLITG